MTEKPCLYLHAGFHKTGTTAIQHCAAVNRSRLLEQGLLYPDFRPLFSRVTEGHHFFAHAVADKGRHLTHEQAREIAREWQGQAKDSHVNVLISAEPACRHFIAGKPKGWHEARRRYLKRLAEYLEGFEVKPILVVRRQDDFVRSLYQESVFRGGTGFDFEAFRSGAKQPRVRFLDILSLFEEVFGEVDVKIYEDLAREGLLDSFFGQLGVSGLRLPDRQVVRKSLGVGETVIKARLNQHLVKGKKRRRQNRQLLKWLDSWRVRWALRRTFDGSESLWRGLDERMDYLAGFEDENRKIAREFFNGRDPLFPPLPESSESSSHWCDPAQVNNAVARVVKASPRRLRRILGQEAVAELMG